MTINISHLRKVISYFLICIAITSCNHQDKAPTKNPAQSRQTSKVKEPITASQILDTLNIADNIKHLDLRNLSLKDLPDLSPYTIESIDLSYNELDTLQISRLPKNLKRLICTHNKLRLFKSYTIIGGKSIYDNSHLNLEEIDLSYNNLSSMHYTVWNYSLPLSKRNKSCRLLRANFSNNQLTHLIININCNDLAYLDISSNTSLSNIFDFPITTVKTVVRDSIKNNLPLKMKTFPPPKPISCG